MKTFTVLALFFIAVNSSFLRNLAAETYTLSNIKFAANCYDLLDDTTTNLSASASSDKGTDGVTTFKGTFTSGENKIESTSSLVAVTTVQEATVTTITWTAALTTAKTGVYKLTSVEDTADNSEITFTLPEKNDASCVVTVTATVNTTATSTTAQEVTEGDETKGTFTFVVEEEIDQPPVVYTAATEGKVISNCKVETKNVVCTPTSEEMEDGKEYTIYYQNGCEATTLTDSKAKVKFTAAEEASSFMTLGKIALFALALLF